MCISPRPSTYKEDGLSLPSASRPQTYHARGQEHRHVVAVPQIHLQEEVPPARSSAPAKEEVWWAWGHCGFQVLAPAHAGGREPRVVSMVANPALEVWRSGVGSEGLRDSLGYLPEVLTAVADAAGTARPPGMQPSQPH